MREFALDQLAAAELHTHVALRPVLGAILDHGVVLAGLEGLQARGLVLVELVLDVLEVVRAAPHIQVAAPVARVAAEGDAARAIVALDEVRPAADRLLEGDLVEGRVLAALRVVRLAAALAPLGREHRQVADDQRQLLVAALEVVADGALIHHRHLGHIRRHAAVGGARALAHQHVVRIFDVGGAHRVAVGEARERIEMERDGQLVGRHAHVVREQAVAAGGLVPAADQQALEDQRVEPRRGRALDRVRIELVEAGAAVRVAERERAADRRLRVQIGEMREARRVLQVAVFGIAVRGPRGGRAQAGGEAPGHHC